MANRDVAIRFQLLYGDDATHYLLTFPAVTLKINAADQLAIHTARAGLDLGSWAKACCKIDLDAVHGEIRTPLAVPKAVPQRPSGRLDKDSTLEQVYGCLASWLLPPYMAPGLHLYLTRGILTGGFLHDLLTQDMVGAVLVADDANRGSFVRWVEMLHMSLPSKAWGSEAKVTQWANDRQAEAEERER